jgi:hypothetical protein
MRELTAKEVKEYRDTHKCSLQEAKRHVLNRLCNEVLDEADVRHLTADELVPIIRLLVDTIFTI